MKYRSLIGYKYEVLKDEHINLPEIRCRGWNEYISLDHSLLIIKARYAWDGPSGPTFDTPSFMRGSLAHDALYQLIREGKLNKSYRKAADQVLRRICLEDGMSKFRAWYVYKAVRMFGGFSAKPRKKARGRIIQLVKDAKGRLVKK